MADTFYDNLLQVLKDREEWDKDYEVKLEMDIKGILFEPDYEIEDKHSYEVIKNVLNGLNKDDQLDKIFVNLHRVDTVKGYLDDGINIINNFICYC